MKKLLIFYIVFISVNIYSSTLKVALICPRDSLFWKSVEFYAQAAAEDLDIELVTIYANDNYLKLYSEANRLMKSEDKIDAIIFNNYKNQASRLIELADKNNVKAILFNSPMSAEDSKRMGRPREIYKNWILELYPDELNTGIELIKTSIKNLNSNINAVALNGQRFSGAAVLREEVLKKYKDDNSNFNLLYMTNIENWARENAKLQCSKILTRYTDVNYIWTASSNIAKGVYDCVNLNPFKKDIKISTYNFDKETFELIENGHFYATAGGHEVDGALALILFYDYFYGKDFKDLGYILYTPMSIVTKENIGLFKKRLFETPLTSKDFEKIDFKKYSRYSNPSLTKYNFTLGTLLDDLEK